MTEIDPNRDGMLTSKPHGDRTLFEIPWTEKSPSEMKFESWQKRQQTERRIYRAPVG